MDRYRAVAAEPLSLGAARRELVAAGLFALLWPALGTAQPSPAPAPTTSSGARPVLRVGLVPYLSARALLNVYEPIRRHLETALGRPVEFYTAASFAALMTNARDPEQPFTLMPAHLVRLALEDWGHNLVVRPIRESGVSIWGPPALAAAGPAALRGRRIATMDPLSLTSMMFQRWRHAEQFDTVVAALSYPTTNAGLMALTRGDADAIVAAEGQLRDAPGAEALDLQSVVRLGAVITPSFVAHPDVPAAQVQAFRQAMLSYRGGTAAGSSGAQFVIGSPRDFQPYESLAQESRRQLGLPPRR